MAFKDAYVHATDNVPQLNSGVLWALTYIGSLPEIKNSPLSENVTE